jgi:hypothetical protein
MVSLLSHSVNHRCQCGSLQVISSQMRDHFAVRHFSAYSQADTGMSTPQLRATAYDHVSTVRCDAADVFAAWTSNFSVRSPFVVCQRAPYSRVARVPRLKRPTLSAMTTRHLKHRWKTNEMVLRSVNSASGCSNSANAGHLGDFLRPSEVDAPRSGKMCRCYQGRAPCVVGVS